MSREQDIKTLSARSLACRLHEQALAPRPAIGAHASLLERAAEDLDSVAAAFAGEPAPAASRRVRSPLPATAKPPGSRMVSSLRDKDSNPLSRVICPHEPSRSLTLVRCLGFSW